MSNIIAEGREWLVRELMESATAVLEREAVPDLVRSQAFVDGLLAFGQLLLGDNEGQITDPVMQRIYEEYQTRI